MKNGWKIFTLPSLQWSRFHLLQSPRKPPSVVRYPMDCVMVICVFPSCFLFQRSSCFQAILRRCCTGFKTRLQILWPSSHQEMEANPSAWVWSGFRDEKKVLKGCPHLEGHHAFTPTAPCSNLSPSSGCLLLRMSHRIPRKPPPFGEAKWCNTDFACSNNINTTWLILTVKCKRGKDVSFQSTTVKIPCFSHLIKNEGCFWGLFIWHSYQRVVFPSGWVPERERNKHGQILDSLILTYEIFKGTM